VSYVSEQSFVIPGVMVALRRLGEHEQLEVASTDNQGSFAFGLHPDGWYQVETCKDGLNSVIAPVRVSRTARDIAIQLQVSIAN
jgi:hypothetical protein